MQMHMLFLRVIDALRRDIPNTVKYTKLINAPPERKRNGGKMYLAPVHKGAPTVWHRDCGEQKRGVLDWLEMSDQMATVKPTHRVRHTGLSNEGPQGNKARFEARYTRFVIDAKPHARTSSAGRH
jgi:hypothetical protein